MLAKNLVSLLVLAAVPSLLGQAQSQPAAPQSTVETTPVNHPPVRLDGVESGPDGYAQTNNWSGYLVEGSAFKNALGSWIVPEVNCTKTPSTYSSFWVGIDGYTSPTTEQIGTEADCVGPFPNYYAWYEFYPAGTVVISSVPVSPGDKILASVTHTDSHFVVKIKNETTGKTFSTTGTVPGGAQRSSAEWIVGKTCCTKDGDFLPLADFKKVEFGVDYTGVSGTNDATDASASGPIRAFQPYIFKLVLVTEKDSMPEATPSKISKDGTSFDVVWKSE